MLSNKSNNIAASVSNNELLLGVSEQEIFPGSLQLAVLEHNKILAQ
jgi:hypothetical protein